LNEEKTQERLDSMEREILETKRTFRFDINDERPLPVNLKYPETTGSFI